MEEALLSLDNAKSLNSNIAGLWFAEASIQLQKEKPRDAIKAIKKGLLIDNKNQKAYFQLGNAFIMENKLKKALNAFEQAININPNFWQAKNNIGLVFFELNKRDQAIKIWRAVLKIQADAEPKLALASALYKKEPKNKESIRLAQEALAENPDYVSMHHQKEQLWGEKLIRATQELFKNKELETTITKAFENSSKNNY